MKSRSIVGSEVLGFQENHSRKKNEIYRDQNYEILHGAVDDYLHFSSTKGLKALEGGTEGEKLSKARDILLDYFKMEALTESECKADISDEKTRAELAQKVIDLISINPYIPKYSRVLSTYNLKILSAGLAIYGYSVFGLTPVGLFFAGTAAFFTSKFVASHVQSYKDLETRYVSLFNEDDSGFYNKTKTFFQRGFSNIASFIKAATYKAIWQGMLNGKICRAITDEKDEHGRIKKSSQGGYLPKGMFSFVTYSEKSDGFDLKSLSLNAIAAVSSVLVLMYAPIAAPLYRLATAVFPVALFSPLGNLAIAYTNTAKGSDFVHKINQFSKDKANGSDRSAEDTQGFRLS